MAIAYDEACRLLQGERLPAVFVDLDAFARNLERHGRAVAGSGLTIRFATKSIRIVSLVEKVLAAPFARGLMCFSVAEAAALVARGMDDLFVAYPTLQAAALETLADLTKQDKNVSLAVDSADGVEHVAGVSRRRGVPLRIVLDTDMSLRAGKGRVHVGVRRSPLHDPGDVARLAERARDAGLVVHGLLGYEAQVAGLGDDSPFDAPWTRAAKGLLRRTSMRELGERRPKMVEALSSRGFDLAFVNGGGTGSIDVTTRQTGVTEISAGSGLFKPLLFDGYSSAFVRGLEPSCFFALEAVRRPAPGYVTCLGGGYVASGAAGPDKLPEPVLPHGLRLLSAEGAGEVQTPVFGEAADAIDLGGPVVFRHAKAGEVMERFREVLLVERGRVVDRVPTYRGDGYCFV